MNQPLKRRYAEKDLRAERFRSVIEEYQRLMPSEFEDFKKGQSEKLDNNATKFAELKGSDMVVRALFELPETLYTMMNVKLEEEDMKYIRTKEGGRWFAKTFTDFRSAEKI